MKKSTNKLLSLVLALVMSVSLAACGSGGGGSSAAGEPEQSPSSSEAALSSSSAPESSEVPAEDGVTVTDQAGRQVTISGPVNKIVSGYYISSSTCIALGLGDKLVGIESKADSRPIYALAAPELLQLPNVGSAKEFNLEACIALEPDLVILPKRLVDSAETMAELGIPVILVSPENREDLAEMVTLIGKAAGAEDKAAKLTAYYEEELAAMAGLTGSLSEKPVVYMGGNSAYLSTAPKEMYQASLIEIAGGVNAAAGVDGDNWTDVSYEQLLAMNPAVIVIPSEASYAKADILGDAQLADVAAVKEGKIYQMPQGFEMWDSPVPSCTLGARWLLSALHEEVYPLEALQADAAGFYKEFYGIEIDTALIGK